jgi:hypothetical protein
MWHSTVRLRIPMCSKQGWHTVRVVVKWIHCDSGSPVRYPWFKTHTEDDHRLTPNFSCPSRGRLVQGSSSEDPCIPGRLHQCELYIPGRLHQCERKSLPVFHPVSPDRTIHNGTNLTISIGSLRPVYPMSPGSHDLGGSVPSLLVPLTIPGLNLVPDCTWSVYWIHYTTARTVHVQCTWSPLRYP